ARPDHREVRAACVIAAAYSKSKNGDRCPQSTSTCVPTYRCHFVTESDASEVLLLARSTTVLNVGTHGMACGSPPPSLCNHIVPFPALLPSQKPNGGQLRPHLPTFAVAYVFQ